MRWLVGIVAVAGMLWAGWWVVGSTLAERGAVAAVEAARADGWDITYDDLSVAGFPNRFDTTVGAPRVTTPDGLVTWTAPFLQVFALSYRPNEVIAVAPHEMRVEGPFGTIAVRSEDLRASARVTLSANPDLTRATAVARGLDLDGGDWSALVQDGQVATRTTGAPDTWDLAVGLSEVRLDGALRDVLDPGGALPETVGAFDLDATAVLPEGGGLTGLDLRRTMLRWGDMRVAVEGAATIGADGLPEGAFTLRLRGWETALRLLEGAGLIPAERLPLITAGVAGMADDAGEVTVELRMIDGQMRLGAIPLGPVPRLTGL